MEGQVQPVLKGQCRRAAVIHRDNLRLRKGLENRPEASFRN